MLCYAVIDTNVFVSALLARHEDTATVQVVSSVLNGDITPLYSREILQEYQEVLQREKFHFTEESVHHLLQFIIKYGEYVETTSNGLILPDEKDIPFYAVVLEKRKDSAYLVTGNLKHFPQMPFVVTAKEMLEIIRK